MRSYKEQVIEPVTASDILSKARDRKAEGYRLVQICATKFPKALRSCIRLIRIMS